jgi:hypothetical protein
MSFNFSGMFANGDAAVMEDFRGEFRGIGRMIASPFVGFGVAWIEQAVPTTGGRDVTASDSSSASGSCAFLPWH